MKSKFIIVKEQSRINWMKFIKCPKCKHVFGLEIEFIEDVGDINYQYVCPYCVTEAGLKDDED